MLSGSTDGNAGHDAACGQQERRREATIAIDGCRRLQEATGGYRRPQKVAGETATEGEAVEKASWRRQRRRAGRGRALQCGPRPMAAVRYIVRQLLSVSCTP